MSTIGKWKWKSLNCVWLCNPWTLHSMEFSRPECWSGQPFPSPGDLPNPGIKPRSPALQADSLPAEPQGSPRILEWVAYPFSSRSSQPRNWIRVSCIAGGFFTNWAIREAQHNRKPTYCKSRFSEVISQANKLLSIFYVAFLSWKIYLYNNLGGKFQIQNS